MDLDTYKRLRSQARRLTSRDSDAEDLVQDALLAGVKADRSDLPWLSGALRKLAAMQARTAVRRRRREHAHAHAEADDSNIEDVSANEAVSAAAAGSLARMRDWPPASRRLAVLALHGLSAAEIRWILQLTPEAFRQRLGRLRGLLAGLSPPLRAEALALAYLRDPARVVDLQFGLVRRALLAALAGHQGLASHDRDGHLLVIRPRGHAWRPGGNQ
ncbi:RNA polymerase sigma factor [Pseudoxanthomonas dokdonensis]|uniref:Uncharacterized protein n=1 Tax=Pseudoxanthomonas dokdonensis TaxID=344882 RepID=A0A0R0CYE4_9GAMM|nr:sigma factor [Pseudoxanthomonas dokdonensis]KRG71450.1 hypothetical protein ABB29_01315 [Pseudoxanthomonas dokdonensis]